MKHSLNCELVALLSVSLFPLGATAGESRPSSDSATSWHQPTVLAELALQIGITPGELAAAGVVPSTVQQVQVLLDGGAIHAEISAFRSAIVQVTDAEEAFTAVQDQAKSPDADPYVDWDDQIGLRAAELTVARDALLVSKVLLRNALIALLPSASSSALTTIVESSYSDLSPEYRLLQWENEDLDQLRVALLAESVDSQSLSVDQASLLSAARADASVASAKASRAQHETSVQVAMYGS